MADISLRDRLLLDAATLGPLGRRLPAPGTMGSLAATLAAPWLFLPLGLGSRLALLAGLFLAGAVAAHRAEQLLDRKDPGEVNIDEVLGQWLTYLPLGLASGRADVLWLLVGLGLFRLFDIAKPWPVRAAETWLPGGLGVMLDDAVAGLLAAVLLAVLLAL